MITVKELLEACQEQVNKGNGDKEILVWNGEKYINLEKLFFDQTNILVSVKPADMPEEQLLNSVILG